MAAPSGIVFILVDVVLEFQPRPTRVTSSSLGENLSSVGSGQRWRMRHYLVGGIALELLPFAVRRVRGGGGT
jgi:hypothetical protein